MSSKKKNKNKKKSKKDIKQSTPNKRRSSNKLAANEHKKLEAIRKRLEKERKKLDSDKKQLKMSKNKFENESAKFRVQTQKKKNKNSNASKRMQHQIDGYKAEIHSLKKYKQQIISLKKRQQKKRSHKKNAKVQYVFTENIKQIKILNQGASILFHDGSDERIFPHIRIILPKKVKQHNKMIQYMFNELQERIEDMKHIQNSIDYKDMKAVQQYVNEVILQRHTTKVAKLEQNVDRLMTNNKLWRYSLLKKEEIKGSIFATWMKAQADIKNGKQPDICKQHGIELINIYKEKKLNVVHELDRAFHARRFQHHINTKTQAMCFLGDHHGQYEYDEDDDLSREDDKHLKLNMHPVSSELSSMDIETPSHSINISASYPYIDAAGTDEAVSEYIETLQMNEEQKSLWMNIGVFLDTILPNKSITNNDVSMIIMKLVDGVIFAEIIQMLKHEFIDLRLMQHTLDKEQIIQNISLVIHSIYALNLSETLHINPTQVKQRYLDASYTVSVMLHIAGYLINAWFDKEMNIAVYPELIRLCQNEDERNHCNRWSHKTWLKRWLLFIKHPKLKHSRKKSGMRRRSLKHSIDLREHLAANEMKDIANARGKDNYQTDLERVQEDEKENEIRMDIIIICDYRQDIELVRERLKLEIEQSEDKYKSSYYLQEWILCKMFKEKNNIEPLSEHEQQSITKLIHTEDDEDTQLIAWINWMNALHDFKWKKVTNLEDDISDGLVILHLLNLCKANCVSFEDNKKVKRKIRNKFDKISNCKEALNICEEQFQFKVIGINENVIVDGNKKYIHSLLSQIKMYSITQCVSNYLQSNISIANLDSTLIQWMNKRFVVFKKQNQNNSNVVLSKEVTSLNEVDSIYCLNLISSMDGNEKYVNYSWINTENDHKVKNALYLMNILRKCGCNIFANAGDIVECKHDVMISIISCIIDLSQR